VKGTPKGARLVLEGQASGLLFALVDYFAAAGVALPERRYVAPGTPGLIAWDCEQVVISLSQVGLGAAEDYAMRTPQMGSPAGLLVRYASWSIQLVRCTPTQDDEGNPPPAEDIAAAGLASLVDVGLLSQFVTNTGENPPFWADGPGNVRGGAVVPIGPAGNYHGYEATVTLSAMSVVTPGG
jgi:hypothetical protein